jgi:hypothetical protein
VVYLGRDAEGVETTMTETTGKSAAAALAKELLRERIALVNELGAQIDAHKVKVAAVAEARAAEQEAAEAARASHAAAIAGGWTARDLKNAGLAVPAAPRARRTDTGTVQDNGIGHDASVASTDS